MAPNHRGDKSKGFAAEVVEPGAFGAACPAGGVLADGTPETAQTRFALIDTTISSKPLIVANASAPRKRDAGVRPTSASTRGKSEDGSAVAGTARDAVDAEEAAGGAADAETEPDPGLVALDAGEAVAIAPDGAVAEAGCEPAAIADAAVLAGPPEAAA